MKTCSKCSVTKGLDAFGPRKNAADGRKSTCRECRNAEDRATNPSRRAYRQTYRSKNKDRLKEYHLAWEHKNRPRLREKLSAQAKVRYWENPDRAKANAKKWRLKNKEKAMQSVWKWRNANRDKVKAARRRRRVGDEGYFWQIKSQFGLTKETYLEMLCEQNGLCKVCDGTTDGGRLNVDHAHVDGYARLGPADRARLVRGLLCWTCNVAIGLLKDDPRRADRAASYLRGEL